MQTFTNIVIKMQCPYVMPPRRGTIKNPPMLTTGD